MSKRKNKRGRFHIPSDEEIIRAIQEDERKLIDLLKKSDAEVFKGLQDADRDLLERIRGDEELPNDL